MEPSAPSLEDGSQALGPQGSPWGALLEHSVSISSLWGEVTWSIKDTIYLNKFSPPTSPSHFQKKFRKDVFYHFLPSRLPLCLSFETTVRITEFGMLEAFQIL